MQSYAPNRAHSRIEISFQSLYNQYMQMSFDVNGHRLRQLRVERALTLRALAERSGVSYDTINKLELGQRPARLSTIRKLADTLGVEPKELMKGEE